jgi:NAD(P)-dependent dehydrogenase (short-subunit alcohol dehydrogenase family)
MSDFSNLNVVVTGGTGALGGAVVAGLVHQGAEVYLPCLTKEDVARSPWLKHERVHHSAPVDLSIENDVVNYYASLPEVWASIHIAGGFGMAPITDITLAQFQTMMNMNAVSCFLACREAVRAIRKGNKGGRLVNVAARPALNPVPGMTAYLASKAAVVAMTQGLALELVSENILVNAVVPSIMDTPGNRKAMPDADHSQWPKVEEVAAAILFLTSEGNRVTNGGMIPVYGKA